MKMVPDLATLRLIPWLPKTALVFCDVYTEEGEPIEEAPRWILKRQIERAAALGYVVKTAAELELYCFKESFDEARAKRYHELTPVSDYLEDYHILQTSQARSRSSAPSATAWKTPTSRWRRSKGEWGAGQEEINLRYAEALEMADRAALFKHGVKEIADQHGSRRHVHGQVRHGRGRLVVPPALVALGPRRGASRSSPDGKDPAGRRCSVHWLGRPAGDGARAGATSTRRRSTPTSATRRARSRPRASWPASTIAPAASASAARARGFRVENRIPGADANPYLAFAATIAAGLHGIAQQARRRRSSTTGNAYEDATLPQVPKTLREAVAALERSQVAREALRRTASSSTTCTPRASSSRPSTPR